MTIRDVSILHGGHFAILATGVDNLTIDNLRIDTNRDGIDVDAAGTSASPTATVNSPYDDGICLKSCYGLGVARATENVTITNCQVSGYDEGTLLDGTFKRTVKYTRGPTGRIKFGTESNGGFKNVTIANCVFDYCRGLAIESVDGGLIEDVAITNLTMRDIVERADLRPPRQPRARAEQPAGRRHAAASRISNIVASNVDSAHGILVSGIPGHPVEDLRLSDIRDRVSGRRVEGGRGARAAREGGGVSRTRHVWPDALVRSLRPARDVAQGARRGVHRRPAGRPARHTARGRRGCRVRQRAAAAHAGAPAFLLRQVKDFFLRNCPTLPDTRRQTVVRESF